MCEREGKPRDRGCSEWQNEGPDEGAAGVAQGDTLTTQLASVDDTTEQSTPIVQPGGMVAC